MSPFPVGVIHVDDFVLIGASYRSAEFAAIYPMMRGAVPLIVAAFGLVLFATMIGVMVLGERLGLARVAATTAVFAGLACMRLA